MKKYFNKVLPTLLVAALMLGTFQLVRSATPAEADVGGAGIEIGQFDAGWSDKETTGNAGANAADGIIDDDDMVPGVYVRRVSWPVFSLEETGGNGGNTT